MAVHKMSVAFLLIYIGNLYIPAVSGKASIEDIDGTYKSTFINWMELGYFFRSIGYTKEDERPFGKPNLGNFEIKVLDKETHEIEIKIQILTADKNSTETKTHILKPGSPGELSWWDGRLFSVDNMKKFELDSDENFMRTEMKLKIDEINVSLKIKIGNKGSNWEYENIGSHTSQLIKNFVKKQTQK